MKHGEYARTRNGIIFQVDEENKNIYMNEFMNMRGDRDIVKHSKLISEVVEVGDFINGKLIHKIDKGQKHCYLYYGNCKTFVNYQIESILTKEMYEQNVFKVVE